MSKKILGILVGFFLIFVVCVSVGDASTIIPSKNRTTEIVVAASNSSLLGRLNADYDCSGVNDDITIDAAIAKLPSTGGTIKLLAGTYDFSGNNILINGLSNIRIEGSGEGATIFYNTSANATTGPMIWIRNSTDVTLSDFTVNRNSNTIGPDAWQCLTIAATGSNFVDIGSVETEDTYNMAMVFGANSTSKDVNAIPFIPCDNVRVHDCYIHNSYKDGIHFFGGNNLHVENNYFAYLTDDAIAFSADKKYPVSNVTVLDNSGNNLNWKWSSAIKLCSGWLNLTIPAPGIFTNVDVKGNQFFNLSQKFFVISPENENGIASDNMVNGLIVDGNTSDNTILITSARNVTITNNKVGLIEVGDTYYYSDATGKATHINISGNTANKITIKGFATVVRVSNNLITVGNGAGYGVRVVDGTSNISIIANKMLGLSVFPWTAIMVEDSTNYPSDIYIANNYIDTTEYKGIVVGYSNGIGKYAHVYFLRNTLVGNGMQIAGTIHSAIAIIGNTLLSGLSIGDVRGGSLIQSNTGYNPIGAVTVAVPVSGTAVAAAGYDRTFYISNGSTSVTMAIGSSIVLTLAPNAQGSVFVPAGQTLKWTGGGTF